MIRSIILAGVAFLAITVFIALPRPLGAGDESCGGPSLHEISECFRTCANLFEDPEAQASCVSACGRINGES